MEQRRILLSKILFITAATVCICFVSNIPSAAAVTYNTWLNLYIGGNYNDRSVALVKTSAYNYNLSAYDFNDRTHSIKFNGIWILYEHINFNEKEAGDVIWRYGFDQQEALGKCGFGEKLSSVRAVGNNNNWKTVSLNFFSGENFTGLGTTNVEANKLNLFFNFTSLVVVGKGSWTFHEGVDYTGSSFCLNTTQDVTFFPNVTSMASLLPGVKIVSPDEILLDGNVTANAKLSKIDTKQGQRFGYYSFRSVEKGCYACDKQNEIKTTTDLPVRPKK